MLGENNCQTKIYTPNKVVLQDKGWNKDTFRGIQMEFSTNRSSLVGTIQTILQLCVCVCVTWKTDSNISLLLQRAKYSQKEMDIYSTTYQDLIQSYSNYDHPNLFSPSSLKMKNQYFILNW